MIEPGNERKIVTKVKLGRSTQGEIRPIMLRATETIVICQVTGKFNGIWKRFYINFVSKSKTMDPARDVMICITSACRILIMRLITWDKAARQEFRPYFVK